MTENIVHKIMSSIDRQWNIVENFLYYPANTKEFAKYLKNYRGLPNSSSNSAHKRTELAEKSAFGVINFFVNIFLLEGLAALDCQEIETVLAAIEKNINLALYYWFGLNDRNYQFRTWIHFFNLEGVSSIFLTKNENNYCVTLTESGIFFGLNNIVRLPQILPISKILIPLEDKQETSYEGQAHNGCYLRKIFARLRTIQREICLLIDEWEYQNSVLAVEYSRFMQSTNGTKNNDEVSGHNTILKKLDVKRNFFARFCLEALCDFHEWINLIHKQKHNSDILSEVDALCALMLSSFQKFFLPASVSRLVYENDIILLFNRFIKVRLEYCPEDFSAQLALQATESALGHDLKCNLLSILKLKPFEWRLCFDPSSALKAFSWAYSKKHHILLSTIMGVSYFKKCYSNHLEEIQFFELLNTYQTQDAFLSYLNKEPLYENSVSILENDIRNLVDSLSSYLVTHVKQSEQCFEAVKMIKIYLSCL